MGVTSFDAIGLRPNYTPITANPGGGQANAYVLRQRGDVEGIYVIKTVATAGDSVALPLSKGLSDEVPVGTVLVLINASANAVQVYGQGTDTINGAAANAGVSQNAGVTALYILAAIGVWYRLLSA